MGFLMARRAEGDQILGDVITLLISLLNVMHLNTDEPRVPMCPIALRKTETGGRIFWPWDIGGFERHVANT